MDVKTSVSLGCRDHEIVGGLTFQGEGKEKSADVRVQRIRLWTRLVTYSGGAHVSSTDGQQISVQMVFKDSVFSVRDCAFQ